LKTLSVNLKIIGVVHSTYKLTSDISHFYRNNISEIEIYEEYIDGLKDIEDFSHIHVFYWFHKSKGFSLHVKTPWENTPHGIFATRSPHRPNQIAHTIVNLKEKKDKALTVKGLDAIEGTPILDIKPYIKKLDIKKRAVSGWLEKIDLKNY
jgi:formylmethanofuran dehydrogenase subunit E